MKIPLTDTLSVLLPTPDETCLLRACLHSGQSAHAAWEAWLNCVGDPVQAFKKEQLGTKRLLPLLFTALQRNGIVADRTLLPYLRAAHVSEELRSKAFRKICHDVLAALTMEGIAFVALKGAALSETAYRDWTLRHSHDIDLLLHESDLDRVRHVLCARESFAPSADHRQPSVDVKLVHNSGLPLELHGRLFRTSYYTAPIDEMWAHSQSRAIADIPARILSPANMLLHIVGQASCCRSRESLQWVCDAWYVLAQHPNLDWEHFAEHTQRCRLSLPLSIMLDYLVREMNAPVPAAVLDSLHARAAQTDTVGRDVALFGARMGTRGTFRSLLRRSSTWRSYLDVLRWMLFPSPSYLRYTRQRYHPLLLPAYYFYRPLRYTSRRTRNAIRARSVMSNED